MKSYKIILKSEEKNIYQTCRWFFIFPVVLDSFKVIFLSEKKLKDISTF